MPSSHNQVVRPRANFAESGWPLTNLFVVADDQIPQPGEDLAVGPAGSRESAVIVGSPRSAPDVDVGSFDDPMRPGQTFHLLRFDGHELKDRGKFLHLRLELGDTLRQAARIGPSRRIERDGDYRKRRAMVRMRVRMGTSF